ncbi:uncharacterized protein CEXT_62681 [Caerostris extrusa]|uniref:Uncharacterized protein n=1 Tax=Caerostris extrusa TaxID=172846 RepID=A0AAV4VUX5_CAEEX|nr:uncharacterized protein CEXT_62681 [Caerostris extrusa]
MDDPETQQTAQFLWTITNKLSTICPAASRFYMSNLKTLDKESKCNFKKEIKPSQHCKHCGSLWIPGNHKIRIQPVPRPNSHIKKTSEMGTRRVMETQHSAKKEAQEIYTCNSCKKTTTFPGLKKYSTKDKNISFSTPAPKIKLKKGDLNAGLFMKTPVDHLTKKTKSKLGKKSEILKATNFSEKMNSSEKGLKQNVISLSNKLLNMPNPQKEKRIAETHFKSRTRIQKQKKSLSSFLISL